VDGIYHGIDESVTGYLMVWLVRVKAGTTGVIGRDALLADKCVVVDCSPAVARLATWLRVTQHHDKLVINQ